MKFRFFRNIAVLWCIPLKNTRRNTSAVIQRQIAVRLFQCSETNESCRPLLTSNWLTSCSEFCSLFVTVCVAASTYNNWHCWIACFDIWQHLCTELPSRAAFNSYNSLGSFGVHLQYAITVCACINSQAVIINLLYVRCSLFNAVSTIKITLLLMIDIYIITSTLNFSRRLLAFFGQSSPWLLHAYNGTMDFLSARRWFFLIFRYWCYR